MCHQTQLRPLQVLLTRPLDQSDGGVDPESEGASRTSSPVWFVLPTDPLPLQQALVDVAPFGGGGADTCSCGGTRADCALADGKRSRHHCLCSETNGGRRLQRLGLCRRNCRRRNRHGATAAKRLFAAIPATDKPVLFRKPKRAGRTAAFFWFIYAGAAQRRKIAVYQTVPATKEACFLRRVQLLRGAAH